MKIKEIKNVIEFHRTVSCPNHLQKTAVELLDRYDRLEKKVKAMKDALNYCANFAHPSIIQDVAKNALNHKG